MPCKGPWEDQKQEDHFQDVHEVLKTAKAIVFSYKSVPPNMKNTPGHYFV